MIWTRPYFLQVDTPKKQEKKRMLKRLTKTITDLGFKDLKVSFRLSSGKIRIHTTADTLPIWNYMQILETKDLRYLLKLDDYSEFPSLTISLSWFRIKKNYDYQELSDTLTLIQAQLPGQTINERVYKLRLEMYEGYLDWAVNKDDRKYSAAFAKYRQEIDNGYKNFEITNELLVHLITKEGVSDFKLLTELGKLIGRKYNRFSDLYADMKVGLSFNNLLLVRHWVLDYCKRVPISEYKFTDELVTIEQVLNRTIDPLTCSTSKYFQYKLMAEKIHEAKKEQNDRK